MHRASQPYDLSSAVTDATNELGRGYDAYARQAWIESHAAPSDADRADADRAAPHQAADLELPATPPT